MEMIGETTTESMEEKTSEEKETREVKATGVSWEKEMMFAGKSPWNSDRCLQLQLDANTDIEDDGGGVMGERNDPDCKEIGDLSVKELIVMILENLQHTSGTQDRETKCEGGTPPVMLEGGVAGSDKNEEAGTNGEWRDPKNKEGGKQQHAP